MLNLTGTGSTLPWTASPAKVPACVLLAGSTPGSARTDQICEDDVKFYKGLLHFIQIFVVLVVLPRVADFVGYLGNSQQGFDFHDLIRFAFAATLGLGTIGTAYFSDETPAPEYDDEPANPRERKRREREAVYYATMLQAVPYARRAMWLFALLDGSFNLAEAVRGASASGLFDVESHGVWTYLYIGATLLFGVAPTALAIVLSRVISMVDRIPEDYQKPLGRKDLDWVRTIMGNLGIREYRAEHQILSLEERTSEPAPVRSPVRTPGERRTSGLKNNGQYAKREAIYTYAQRVMVNEGRMPGPSEVSRELGVAKGYASEVLADMRNQSIEPQEGGSTIAY